MLAAAFFAAAFVLLIGGGVAFGLLDMNGRIAAEEPIRAFLFQALYVSLRPAFMAIFGLPIELGESVGGISGVFVTVAALSVIPLFFGITATTVLDWRRRATDRRAVATR